MKNYLKLHFVFHTILHFRFAVQVRKKNIMYSVNPKFSSGRRFIYLTGKAECRKTGSIELLIFKIVADYFSARPVSEIPFQLALNHKNYTILRFKPSKNIIFLDSNRILLYYLLAQSLK